MKDEHKSEPTISPELKAVIQSLNPEIRLNHFGKDKHKIVYDGESVQAVLSQIAPKSEKVILQSGEPFGINIMYESTSENLSTLKKMAEESLIHMRNNVPVKKMIGVG